MTFHPNKNARAVKRWRRMAERLATDGRLLTARGYPEQAKAAATLARGLRILAADWASLDDCTELDATGEEVESAQPH